MNKQKTRRVVTTRNGVTKHFVVYYNGNHKIKVQVPETFDEDTPLLEGVLEASKVDVLYAINILLKEGYSAEDIVAAATEFVRKRQTTPETIRLVDDCVREYLTEIRETHDYKTWQVYDRAIKPFTSFLGKEMCVDDISRIHVTSYFAKMKCARETFNSHLRRIKTFANWCVRKGYLQDILPFQAVAPMPIESKEPEFIHVDDMQELINNLTYNNFDELIDPLRLYIILSFFMGIRSAELLHLTNDNIIVSDGVAEGVRVSHAKGASNGRKGRFVPCPTTDIAEYLARVKQEGWFYGFDKGFYKQVTKLFGLAGVYKVSNVGRHSFITYHVAFCGNENITITSAGTSHAMAVSHYRGIVSKKEAEKYFLDLAKQICNDC